MRYNIHKQTIPAQVLQEAQAKLDEVKALLTPYGVALTPEERHDILKMGAKTLDFVEKSHELAQQNPSLCPPYLNMAEFNDDFADVHGLWALQSTSNQINEMISDTTMAAGSDAYHSSLIFYKSVKIAEQNDVPGAKAVYEELRKRFPGGKRNSSSSKGDSAIG
jgi:hypothetical protein